MNEIELILRNNEGNRLTNELIIGLVAMIQLRVSRAQEAEAEAMDAQFVEGVYDTSYRLSADGPIKIAAPN